MNTIFEKTTFMLSPAELKEFKARNGYRNKKGTYIEFFTKNACTRAKNKLEKLEKEVIESDKDMRMNLYYILFK